MLEPFVEAICFPQTWQFAASLSGETVFSYVTSYTAPQWGENFLICKAAFEKALFVYPDATWRCARARGSF
jgi:hypothetical protein